MDSVFKTPEGGHGSNSLDELMAIRDKFLAEQKELPPERSHPPEMIRMPFKDANDVLAEDEAKLPGWKKYGRSMVMGAERSVDALDQFGSNYIYPWLNNIIPKELNIDRKIHNKKTAWQEEQRDARMRHSTWPQKIGMFLGSAGLDPTTYTPAFPKGARVLQRVPANAAESVLSDQFTNPARNPDNYYGEKFSSGATSSVLGPVVGELGHQTASKIIPRHQKYTEELEGALNRGPLNKMEQFFDPTGKPLPELQEALKTRGWNWYGNMDDEAKEQITHWVELVTRKPTGTTPEEIARVVSFNALEIDPMLQNIKRDYGSWSLANRLRNDELGGGPVREAFDKQNKQILEAGNILSTKMGGEQQGREAVGNSVFDLVKELDSGELSRISGLYKDVEKYYADAGIKPNAKPVLQYLDGLKTTELLTQEGRDVIKSVKGLMKAGGFLSDPVKRKHGFNYPQMPVVGKEMPGKNPNEWEALRKSINVAYGNTKSPTQRRLYRKIKENIDTHILDQAGDKFSKARKEYHDYMNSKSNKVIKKIIENDEGFNPAKLVDTISKGSTNDARAIKEYLFTFGGEAGTKAWDNIRSSIWMRGFRKGMKTYSSKNDAGDMVFNGAGFVRHFDDPDTGMTREMREVLFNDTENARIDSMLYVLGDLTIPISGTVNFSNTAYSLINFIQGAGGIQGVHSPMFWVRKAFQGFGSELETMKNIKAGEQLADIEKGFVPAKRADWYKKQQAKWEDLNRRMTPSAAFSGDYGSEAIARTGQGYDWAKEQIQQNIQERRENYDRRQQ